MLDTRMQVPLGQLVQAAEMALAIAVALLVLALLRHDARPYLRLFAAAWLSHAAGLAAWLGHLGSGRAVLQVLSLFLGSVHGVFALQAALAYARGRSSARVPIWPLVAALAWAAALPALLPRGPQVAAARAALVGVLLGAAAAVLWRLREPASSGLQAVAGSLACLAAVGFTRAGFWASADPQEAARWNDVLSLVSLLLIASFGFGLALSLAEAAQWALTATGRQLQEARERLSVIARTDALTGCFNRQVFRELVDDLRAGGRQEGVVVVAELADLSRINAERGASGGDEALREAADVLRDHTRATDLLIRWGSDQFVAVLPGVTLAAAEPRLARLAEAFAEKRRSLGLGAAAYGPGSDVLDAVHSAERAAREDKLRRGAAPDPARP
jgi:diguanylate cyclase (GGDEF)-like protein